MTDLIEQLWQAADDALDGSLTEGLRPLLLETVTQIRSYQAHIDRLQARVAEMDALLVEERKRQLSDLNLVAVGMAHKSVDDRRWVVHSDTSIHMNDRQAFIIEAAGDG